MKLSFPNSRAARLTLGALVVAVAGAVALPAMADPMGGMQAGHGMRGGMMGGHDAGGAMMHFSDRMLDRVKATPEQKTQIRQIMESARKDLQAQREARHGMRDEALKLFTQPNVDAQAAEALRQKQLAQHDQASRRMMQAMVDASRVLSPEQRKQIADGLQQRRGLMERHMKERQALDAPKS